MNEALKDKCHRWMMNYKDEYEYGSAFDLAVDCTADLDLYGLDNPGTMDIPAFVVEIAESIMGKD